MDEQPVTADEARQVPWIKRTKAQRRALLAEANARTDAKAKARLERIDRRHEESVARIADRAGARPAGRPAQRRRSTFGDPNAIVWDYLPHPVLLGLMAVVFLVVLLVVLVIVL